jgi:non-heme chloroperoxidase
MTTTPPAPDEVGAGLRGDLEPTAPRAEAVRTGGDVASAVAGAALPDTDLTLPPGEAAVVTTDDGARLAVTVAGGATATAPTVVLPHCWTGARAVWVPVARRLVARGHRVVLYDQRGHGASTIGRRPITIARLGDDLGAVLDQLDVRDAVLAGHSMGGMTVMAHACRHADQEEGRARGLALIATAAHGVGRRQPMVRAALRTIPVERLMVRERLGCALVRSTFGLAPQRAHVDATRGQFATTLPAVRRECMSAMRAMDLRDGLRAVDLPAVVVLGTLDRVLPNVLTRTIVDHLPGAELVELHGAGHMLPFERPDEVAAVIGSLAA